jgi:transitional endoplasmic reticulum ATPase
VNIDKLAEETEGLTGADIEVLARLASMEAIKDYIKKHEKRTDKQGLGEFSITLKHFSEAFQLLKAKKIN